MTIPRPNRPLVLAAALAAFPVLVWSGLQPFSWRWNAAPAILQSLTQLTGILGLVLFAITLALSARFHWMERLMGPINRVYIAHHLLGTVAFAVLLAHPMLAIAGALMLRQPDIAHYIVPGLDNALTWGILSIWSLGLLMVLTLYLRPRYPLWRKTHQFLGLSLFFAGLHGVFISSDISSSPLLRWYLLGLSGAALTLFLAYTVLNNMTVRRYAYRVADVKKLSDAVMSVRLVPTGTPLISEAGRFVFIRFRIDGRWSEAHPFSLTEAADATGLSLSMKALGDDTKRFFETVTTGAAASLEGPFGAFGREMKDAPRAICIAGGIGVTPFLALLPTLSGSQAADVYYSVRNEKESVHLGELETKAAAAGARIRIFPWYSDALGYLTAGKVKETSGLKDDDRIFLCGPPSLMRALRAQLTAAGVADDRIHSEEFSLN